jgi:hypothetical protein
VSRAAWRVLALLALVLLAGWAVVEAERRGHDRAQRAFAATRTDRLRDTVHHYDTVYRDSLRIATRWQTRWDTVKLRDTVTIENTVYVPLAPAESTINACSAALRSCGRAGLAKDTLIAAQAEELSALRLVKPAPPLTQQLMRDGFMVGVGYLLRALTAK